ncbi:MAG TPA: hypothetical protein VGR37_24375 [Longimicrobiaceae bacterium]|nr:hypothetical protein [Longimicrobiaceae bacterium]
MAPSAAASVRRACSRNTSPTSVSRTPRGVRSKSGAPISRSSSCTWRESADCTTKSRAAARPMFPSSAEATK